jgi:hypothetical protein
MYRHGKRGRTTYDPTLKNHQHMSIPKNRWEAGEATCSRTRRSKHQASHPPTLIEKAPTGGLFTWRFLAYLLYRLSVAS